MSKAVKNWLVIASILAGVGLIIFAGVMFAYDWDFSKLSTVAYETNTYEVSGTFDRISIDVDITEIEFVPADDEACTIVCYEMEKVKHSAAIHNGILTVSTVNTHKWYDYIGISFDTPKMTVYLPDDKYVSLLIETDTGNVIIPQDFSFDTIEIEGDTADIDCLASVSDKLKIESDTGNIKMDRITAGKVSLSTDTGNITLNSVDVKNNVEIETDTGAVRLTDVLCASGRFSIESNTGDVNFAGCDAQEIFVDTDTGHVKGTLLSEKVFITETDTGRIDVPKSTTGGKCEIKTAAGDIKIDIQ